MHDMLPIVSDVAHDTQRRFSIPPFTFEALKAMVTTRGPQLFAAVGQRSTIALVVARCPMEHPQRLLSV